MTKAEARELFSAAYEGELDEARASALRAALDADPELSREYAEFASTLHLMRKRAGRGPAPNLLPGVQRRLRARSRGRFYGDRFAERSGSGLAAPLTLALLLLGVLALAWVGLSLLQQISMAR
jgi:anti-sigma factor RsiW